MGINGSMLKSDIEISNGFVAALDEAGRGSLAGPVFAAAVILPKDFNSELIKDSKKLSEKKRQKALKEIEENALARNCRFLRILRDVFNSEKAKREFSTSVLRSQLSKDFAESEHRDILASVIDL